MDQATDSSDKRRKLQPLSLTSMLGPASNMTFLLSDYSRFSLTERVSYHFHLTEALADSPLVMSGLQPTQQLTSQKSSMIDGKNNTGDEEKRFFHVCGVKRLLECIPTKARPTRQEKRALKVSIHRANQVAKNIFEEGTSFCHEPPAEKLPLRLNPSTRVFFVYQRTRIALLVDASPTITATHGFGVFGAQTPRKTMACCPLDLIPSMTKKFLASLVEPLTLHDSKDVWNPSISLSVLAVFPASSSAQCHHEEGIPNVSILVRDYNLTDKQSVNVLCQQLENWLHKTVEEEISSRLMQHRPSFLWDEQSFPPYHSQQSSLREWLEVGDAALSTMSSEARPLLVVATDCRSVECDSVVNILAAENRVDQPLTILNVGPSASNDGPTMMSTAGRDPSVPTIAELMDRNAYSTPLHISDDSQVLFEICNATNGCFLDLELLEKAAASRVGKIVDADSPFLSDHFLTNRRHTIHPTVVQWYILFSLSPLTPVSNQSCGRLPPVSQSRLDLVSQRIHRGPSNLDSVTSKADGVTSPRIQTIRTTFSMYVINPIRIQNLLQMRIREGYRARRYGARTNDPDRVDILFTLGLDLDTSVHYELSYKALSGYQHMVGSAQIKIYLSGEANFINSVKKEFVQSPDASAPERSASLSQQVSSRLCKMLRWIRKEDMLQSYIAPLDWKDQLVKGAPFLRRLGTLTEQQRRRHFRIDQFDLVCTGRLPYNRYDDAEFLNAFQDNDSGEKNLLQAIAEWSTQLVDVAGSAGNPNRFRFLRKMPSPVGTLASYCLLDIKKCKFASRIYTINVETFGIAMSSDRIRWLNSLQSFVDDIKDCSVLQKQIAPYLVEGHTTGIIDRQRALLEMQHNHAAWELIDDQELLPLITKRRVEIDGFYLVASNDNFAFLAKLMPGKEVGDPGDLVQYRITKSPNLVSVDLHMEIEAGVLFPFAETRSHLESQNNALQFNQLSRQLEKTDKQCGTALRARTNLLSSLETDEASIIFVEKQSVSLATILPHSSKVSMKLRFFHDWSDSANEILQRMICDFLLSIENGTRVGLLSIEENESVPGFGPGDWLVLEYDQETMSLVHVAKKQISEASEGISMSFREVTFNTLSTSDLYFTRQEGFFVEEYMPVSNLSEALNAIHGQLYSAAAFASLQKDNNDGHTIHQDDFLEVTKCLSWREVGRVVIASGSTKLVEIINSVVKQVQGQASYFFYVSEGASVLVADDDSSTMEEYLDGSESSGSLDEASRVDDDTHNILDGASTDDIIEDETAINHLDGTKTTTSPLFFRFLVDDMPATSFDLANIGKSSTVSACVSVFSEYSENTPLPKSHAIAAAHLSSTLQSFVSEQTLERLRSHGAWIEEADLHLAKVCLRRARDVQRSLIELSFYEPKGDQLVRATISGGGDDTIERSLTIFSEQLKRNSTLHLVRFGVGFVVVGIGKVSEQELPFWCFFAVKKHLGGVMVKVHHPEGVESARNVLEAVREEILKTCHQVNQLILLHHMHTSRTASRLLVPEDVDDASIDFSTPETDAMFACPALFKFRFDLFHRCAQSAVQVAMALESTVLHIFALSNRRHIFVYKDEDDSIFYMSLKASEGDEGRLELHVHGVDTPSTSVTTQLTGLLSKRLMQIGLDMLSLVLTKNPHYSWKDADIEFVRKFNQQMEQIEDAAHMTASQGFSVTKRQSKASTRLYAFPLSCFDLGLVMLCFRQNLCGSTYFQPLVVGSSKPTSEIGQEDSATNELGHISNLADSLNFTCFYNNSPSKLNTALQAQSTLTRKGEDFRRAVGTGIAIIKISLVDANGDVNGLGLGTTTPIGWMADGAPMAIDVTDVKDHDKQYSEARLIVSIEDTHLDTDALHGWIMLTLNQVLAGWTMERHIEAYQKLTDITELKFHEGLESLLSMVKSSSLLPHPAAKTWQDTGSIRAPDVADMALRLLEKGLLEPIYQKMKGASKGFLEKHVTILRRNGNSPPDYVKIERDRENASRHATIWRVGACGTKKLKRLQDRPIDSPEYILCLQLPGVEGADVPRVTVPPRLFTNVSLPDEHRKQFTILRDMNQGAFRRVFSLVLRVTRKHRILYAYNWELALFDSATKALADESKAIIAFRNAANTLLERKALGILCSRSGTFLASGDAKTAISQSSRDFAQNEVAEAEDEDKASRRRPIRKPKLIGKSVEGAAAQALAASRARASFKTQPTRAVPGGRNTLSRNIRKPARQSQKKTAVRLSKGQAILLRLQRDIHFQIFSKRSCKRLHTIHNEVLRSVWKHLPLFETKHISETLADFFFQETNVAWSRAIPIFQMPYSVLDHLLFNVGSAIAGDLKGLKLLPLSLETEPDRISSMLLLAPSRNARYSRCCAAAKLKIEEINSQLFIVLQAYPVPSPRRKELQPLKYRHLLEKDSTAFDILCGEISSYNFESLIFEYLAAAAGGTMKSSPDNSEGLMLFESLEKRYPLAKQMKMVDSGLKVAKFPLILPSYRNKFINFFTSEQLFNWLKENNHNLTLVGGTALLFQRDIVVKGTHNTIALACIPEKFQELNLFLICRTNGKDLNEFVFEQNQRVAQSLLTCISIHIAGAIYEELVTAATELYRDFLWKQARGGSSTMPPSEDLLQLIDLGYLSDAGQTGSDLELSLMLDGLGEDAARGVERMLSDPSFWPSYRLNQKGRQTTWMYYFSVEDLFLVIRTDCGEISKNKNVTFQILSRTRNEQSDDSCRIIIQKASNFFLYNAWKSFLCA